MREINKLRIKICITLLVLFSITTILSIIAGNQIIYVWYIINSK